MRIWNDLIIDAYVLNCIILWYTMILCADRLLSYNSNNLCACMHALPGHTTVLVIIYLNTVPVYHSNIIVPVVSKVSISCLSSFLCMSSSNFCA